MQSRPLRALLFVPGTRPDLFEKAARSGADAIVLDLEDAVPEGEKEAARENVAAAVSELSALVSAIFVRTNDLSTPHWRADLQAVVGVGLTGIALPKVRTPADIVNVADALSELEPAAGVEPASVDIQPLLETALGIFNGYHILNSSARVRSFFGGFARDGDVSRELDARWTATGLESLYLRSKLLLEARAAGVPYPISGTWADVRDLDGLTDYAKQNRDLGYTGMYVIHPSHVPVVTAAFTPSGKELDWYRRIIEELDAAASTRRAALMIDGVMIDVAMAARARTALAAFESLTASPP